MAVERGYERQVAPRAGQMGAMSRPEDFGAGLARAVEQVAGEQHQRELRSYQLDRREAADREAADFDLRFAEHRQNMDSITRDLRTNAGPGAQGHAEGWRKANDAARETLLSGITDARVLQQAERQWSEYETRGVGQEGDFEAARGIAKRITDFGKAGDVSVNRIRTGMDPEAYASELKLRHEAIFSQQGLSDELKQKLWDDYQQKAGVGFVQHMQDTNPVAARALLDGGAFEHLDPSVVEQLRNGADVEIRRRQAAEAQAANVAAAQTRERIATVRAMAGQGIDVSGHLPELIQQAQALGDTSTVVELQGLGNASAFARAYEPLTPLQVEGRISELSGIPQDSRTAAQQAELKWATDHRGAMASRFNADPVGWAIENAPEGAKPPPLSAGPAARAQWARETADVYGGQRVLTRAESDAYANRAADGDAGYLQVAEELAQFGGRTAMAAARQVAPSDRYLQQMVVLPPNYRKLSIDGRAARKANPGILKVKDDDQGEAIASINAGFHQALATVPVDQRNAIIDIAGNIAANFQLKHGKTDSEMNSRLWLQAFNMALGATGAGAGQLGGMGRWSDQYFLVPDGVTAQQFTDGVFAQVKRDAKRAPVNPDGTPLYLGRARPVAQGGGRYRFYVGNDVVMGKDGAPWEYQAK